MASPQVQQITQTTSNIPAYAEPYFRNLMNRAEANLTQQYLPYGYEYGPDGKPVRAGVYETDPTTGERVRVGDVDNERIAGFTPAQEQIQQQYMDMAGPEQYGVGSAMATQAGLGALAAGQGYNAANYTAQGVTPEQIQAQQIQAQQYNSPLMQAAQTGWRPELQQYQMQAPEQFGAQQAAQYMSPFQQNVTDIAKREAIRDAKQGQLAQDLGAARQGTYGGSRQLLAAMERERNLGQQLGDIQSRGLQSAYENAQAQFERDRAAGLTTGQTNLQARLGVQQLGTQTGLQAALANLDAESQSRVQNLAAQLQTQGLNADQAMRAAMANQQSSLQAAQANQQAGLQAGQFNSQQNLEAQRLGEQSRQFGAQQAMTGYQLAGQMGQTLGNLGQAQQNSDIQRLNAQNQVAGQQQQLQQQRYDMRYQDFLRQRDYPIEQLGYYSNILRGLPVTPNSTQTTYAPPVGFGQQAVGTGLAAAGIYNTFRGP